LCCTNKKQHVTHSSYTNTGIQPYMVKLKKSVAGNNKFVESSCTVQFQLRLNHQ
jgi:hypothetical protein